MGIDPSIIDLHYRFAHHCNFGLTSAREALKYVFDLCYGLLANPVVKEMFSKYHEAIKSIMSPDYSEKFATHQKVLYIIQSQQRCPENS
jgi:hypothetical protein